MWEMYPNVNPYLEDHDVGSSSLSCHSVVKFQNKMIVFAGLLKVSE